MPALFAGRCFQRNDVVVGSFEVKPIAIHGHPPIPNMVAALRLPEVMPDFSSRDCVDCIRVVGVRDVDDSVDHKRRRLDVAATIHDDGWCGYRSSSWRCTLAAND